ncbi:MAG: amino acid adenylation domain-containing protein [Cyanobacteria bacterium P01_A01_bin.105]
MSRTVQDIYPLSPTQRGLLFHSLYGPQSGAYVIQVGYTLRGELDRTAFEQAWQQLVQRHTVLRTALVWENLDAPVQVVGQQVQLSVNWLDWQAQSVKAQQYSLQHWLADDRRQGFNLSAAPLMRLTVMQLSQACYRVIWSHHHILLDGWSLPILLQEWMAYYRAASAQSAASPALQLTPALPYRDYIAWLQQQDINVAKQFWQQQLAGITAPTALGIDQGMSPGGDRSTRNKQWGAQQQSLSTQFTQQLQTFARQHRLTLSSLVQGAWARVLSCYSADDAVVYGLARAGRPRDLEGTDTRVGLFINTLPMRVEATSQQTVVEYLQQIQSQQLAQQPYEYASLVDVQSVSDIPQGMPLFESVVVFENYPLAPKQTLSGLEVADVAITEQTHYPLTLFASAAETFELKALYDQQRLTESSVKRLLGHLQVVLATMVSQPNGLIQRISPLTQAEQQQLFELGSAVTDRLPEQCVHHAIAQQAAATPDATAVIFDGESLSYGELECRANQWAQALEQRGITPGSVIGLCIQRSLEMVVALLAILKAGCAYVPLDPTYPTARLRYIVEHAELSQVLCHNKTQAIAFGAEIETIKLAQLEADGSTRTLPHTFVTPSMPEPSNELDRLAYLIYTSGSTGQPKGVPIQHRSLSNLIGAMARRLHVKSSDTLMAVTTLSFDIAALELLLPLVSGARLLLVSDDMVRDGHQMIAHIDAYGVDIMQATPATWRLLLGCGWSGQSGLKILCGGEALDSALAKRLLRSAEEVWNVYGPTETTIWSGALLLSVDHIDQGGVPIGHPIDNTRFFVLDKEKKPVPLGVAGELYIGGAGLTEGYWQRPDLTAERFVPNPFDISDLEKYLYPVLYKTGDRVCYREDGTLEYLGRFDHQAKLRGYRIELGEVEAAIAAHPAVSQAVVTVCGSQPESQRLVAYMTLARQDAKTSENIEQGVRSYIAGLLPNYMVPTAYSVLPSFPLTPNGKVDRKALPDAQIATTATLVKPETPVETILAEIWQSLLGVGRVSLHDNFFDVGGHSLLVVNAQSQIRQRLAVEVSLMDLFRYPTLKTLAEFIQQQQTGATEQQEPERTVALSAGKQRLKRRLKQRQDTKSLGGAQS